MTAERSLPGVPAAPGRAAGPALRARSFAAEPAAAAHGAAEERERAERALAAAGAELERVAAELRDRGEHDGAAIVEANAQICADPALRAEVAAGAAAGRSAPAAIEAAIAVFAERIASLPDPLLAARAADVRSIGRRALAQLDGGAASSARGDGEVLVGEELGPADVLELDGVAAIALARGAPGAHASIIARSLGLPMVVGLGDAILAVGENAPLLVDGDAGVVTVDPAPSTIARLRRSAPAPLAAADRAPVLTADGRRIAVLVNASGAAEVRAGIEAGADGIGLLRSEIAFLDAAAWPSEAEHRAALAPLLELLPAGFTCTARTLDFGADKTPPFLAGTSSRGIELQLASAGALAAQMRALERVAAGSRLRVLLPVVQRVEQIDAARELLPAGAELGAMIETVAALQAAPELLAACDFASVGTNDLAHELLGVERTAAVEVPAHEPRVLDAIRLLADHARSLDVPLEVCGEAASDRTALPLLIGLGVDELSVGAAFVAPIKAWLRGVGRDRLQALAERALGCADAAEVAELVGAELAGERLDRGAELLERLGGVGTARAQLHG